MNISDSQRIATKIESLGYKSAPEKEADLVIVNACSVRQKAVDRIWGGIKKWQKAGKEIIITGCVLPADKKILNSKNITVFNIQDLQNLNEILYKHSYVLKNLRISSRDSLEYFHIPVKNDNKIAYIPIMTGCDNFCSYCAVPYTRGREISRPMKDIITDVKKTIKDGFKEILLLGQNVNSYNKCSSDYNRKINNDHFIKLLITIDSLPGDFEFNFISSNPHDITDEIIKTFSELKKWPKELHLPMQSGDDEILRKMNRKYDSQKFLKLVSSLKSLVPDIRLSTDIIVGFPGETKTQFENTVKICKKIGFKKAYISQYSPRPGTAATKLKDNVPAKEKKRRWKMLDELINKNLTTQIS